MLAVVIAVASIFGSALPAQANQADRERTVAQRPFGLSSIWVDHVDGAEALSPLSLAYVRRLQTTINEYGAWINSTEWSAPVYTVTRHQPTTPVTLDFPASQNVALQREFERVPIPRNATASPDTDEDLVIWQPRRDRMWEFWGARRVSGKWHARYGGRMDNVSSSPGYFTSAGATATGLPLLGGLIRTSELRAGFIPHALALTLPDTRAHDFVFPAQRTDGTSDDPFAIPEGTRFRLDPNLDLGTLNLPPPMLAIARAAQTYGMYVTDRGGAVAFEVEQPEGEGTNPYPALFGGRSPSELMSTFPWDKLQVVEPQDPAAAGP